MVITTRSGNTSMMGQIIEQQITQLRYTGLFLALTGNLGDELPRIYAFYDVIKKTLKVASIGEVAKEELINTSHLYVVRCATSSHTAARTSTDP